MLQFSLVWVSLLAMASATRSDFSISNDECACPEVDPCDKEPINAIFSFDESYSTKAADYDLLRTFALDLLVDFNKGSYFSMIQWGGDYTYPLGEMFLNYDNSIEKFKKDDSGDWVVERFYEGKNTTSLGKSLIGSTGLFNAATENGSINSSLKKVNILFTDGIEKTRPAVCDVALDEETTWITVGIGSEVQDDELICAAGGKEDNVVYVESFEDFEA